MPVLTLTLVDPVGVPVTHGSVAVRLVATTGIDEALGFTTTLGGVELEIAGSYYATPDLDGLVEFDLVGNDAILPANTVYRVDVQVKGQRQAPLFVTLPSTGGPYTLYERLTSPPTDLDAGYQKTSQKDHAGGYPSLDAYGRIPVLEIPDTIPEPLVGGTSVTGLTWVSRWGLRSNLSAYYDAAGAVANEAAFLHLTDAGTFVLLRPE